MRCSRKHRRGLPGGGLAAVGRASREAPPAASWAGPDRGSLARGRGDFLQRSAPGDLVLEAVGGARFKAAKRNSLSMITVHDQREARARPIITSFTTQSARMNTAKMEKLSGVSALGGSMCGCFMAFRVLSVSWRGRVVKLWRARRKPRLQELPQALAAGGRNRPSSPMQTTSTSASAISAPARGCARRMLMRGPRRCRRGCAPRARRRCARRGESRWAIRVTAKAAGCSWARSSAWWQRRRAAGNRCGRARRSGGSWRGRPRR